MLARLTALELDLKKAMSLEARFNALEGDLAVRIERATRAHDRVETLSSKIEELESKLDMKFGGLEGKISELELKLSGFEATVGGFEASFRSTETAGNNSSDQLEQLEEGLQKLMVQSARLDPLEARIAQVENTQSEVESNPRVADISTSDPPMNEVFAGRLAALETQLDALKQTQNNSSDLTSIRGVGPKYAKALIAAGVQTKAEVAAMTDTQIVEVAAVLSVPEKRVQKWREAASG